MTDDEFMAKLTQQARAGDRFIGTTWIIASRTKMTTPDARKRMVALEKAGKVRRIEKWSGPNSIAWALT